MDANKYSILGKKIGKAELSDSLFGVEVNDVLIYELVKALNANQRQGTHSTKTRSEVRGGGIKPWRQKGTGRARHGSIRSPIWRSGGIAFGPKPRNYRIEIPKNLKKAAYKSLFSLKFKEGSIKVVEDFSVDGKTKDMAKIGKALSVSKGLLVTDNEDALLKRAMRNIPWFTYNNVKRISGRDIFYSRDIIITESALKYLNEKYS